MFIDAHGSCIYNKEELGTRKENGKDMRNAEKYSVKWKYSLNLRKFEYTMILYVIVIYNM